MPILVSGLINIETTLQVEMFPIHYTAVRYPFYGIQSTVSGVGVNVAKALHTLGSEVRPLSIIGRDLAGDQARQALSQEGLDTGYVLAAMVATAQSVILYDLNGRRQINVDLKDVQEQVYPRERFEQAAEGCEVAALCNVNFSRPMLTWARERGMVIATDVHAIGDLDDEYNGDFMRAADILFMSDEHLPAPPEVWARRVLQRYGNDVVVIGLGAQGALLAVKEDDRALRVPPVQTRPVVNTIGAGDALFSCFLHVYGRTGDPYLAMRKAMVFASYKVGAAGAADGFLSAVELDRWHRETMS